LTRIEVVKPKEWDPRQSGIQFEIQAQLRIGSDLESVKFDALLAKDSRHFRVSSGA
jgi:predicted component of type VI protein secretion system